MNYLIVRSAPIEHYTEALKHIHDEYGEDVDISVITHVDSNANIIAVESVRLFDYDGARLHVFTLGFKTIRKIRKMRFDKVIVLCTNPLAYGYGNIMFLLLVCNIFRAELWHANGTITAVYPMKFLAHFLLWHAELAVCAVIWSVLFVVQSIQKGIHAYRNRSQRS